MRMSKRNILSKMTAALLFVMLMLQMPAFAAADNRIQIENAANTTITSPDGIAEISKTIFARGDENYFDIRLTVTETVAVKYDTADIVLVLDISNTMNSNSRLTNAKKAANQFVDLVFDDSKLKEYRRIGLVTFNSNAKQVVSLADGTSNNAASLKTTISGITAPDGDIRFTNIEGGLLVAQNMLKSSTATNKYIILITDGFPTTYTKEKASNGLSMTGHNTYDTSGTIFKNRRLNKPCMYGTDYSDNAATAAQNAAAAIKKDPSYTIMSIGINVSEANSQTINGFLQAHAGKNFSTVDCYSGSGNYVIGNGSSTTSYENWLRNSIGSGYYYNGNNSAQLQSAFQTIASNLGSTPAQMIIDEYVTDPIAPQFEFLGFYDINKNFKSVSGTTTLHGSHVEGGENTASYQNNMINWIMDDSGYKSTAIVQESDGKITGYKYEYELGYRVRIRNEEDGFGEKTMLNTNGFASDTTPSDGINQTVAQLHATALAEYAGHAAGKLSLNYPHPQAQAFLGNLSFKKVNAVNNAPVAGAQFALTHNPDTCPVCKNNSRVVIDRIESNISGTNGVITFNNVPSGHDYTLSEIRRPYGYQLSTKTYPVRVTYGKTYVNWDSDFVQNNPDSDTVKNTPVTPTSFSITGSKYFDNQRADGYTFHLYNASNVKVATATSADGKFAFDDVPLNQPGTYVYTIKEDKGTDGSVFYDPTIYTVSVTVDVDNPAAPTMCWVSKAEVTNASTGKNVLTLTSSNPLQPVNIIDATDELVFNNSTFQNVGVSISLKKTLDHNLSPRAGAHTFTIEQEVGGSYKDEVVNDDLGEATFKELYFNAPGEYKFLVKETAGSNQYFDYDQTEYRVTVTVAQQSSGSNALKATVAYTKVKDINGNAVEESVSAITFHNASKDKQTVKFSFKKVNSSGKSLEGVEFTLTHDKSGCFSDCTATETETISDMKAVSNSDGLVKFEGVPNDHVYTLKETKPLDGYSPVNDMRVQVIYGNVNIDGVILNNLPQNSYYTVTNALYNEAEVQFLARKLVYSGSDNNRIYYEIVPSYFDFVLEKKVGDGWETVETLNATLRGNKDDGYAVIFNALTFNTTGSHLYRIYEKNKPNDTHVSYDPTVYYVRVVVEPKSEGSTILMPVCSYYKPKNPSEAEPTDSTVFTELEDEVPGGTVNAVTTGWEVFRFENRVNLSARVQLKARKTLDEAYKSGNFVFYMIDDNTGAKTSVPVTITEGATSADVVFDEIVYTAPGKYTYTIGEEIIGADGWVYDNSLYTATVTVKLVDGNYQATVAYTDKATEATEAQVALPVFHNHMTANIVFEKISQDGRPLGGAVFELVHTCTNCESPIPAATETSRASDGRVVFSNVVSGHSYQLRETKAPESYSPAHVHNLKVEQGKVYWQHDDTYHPDDVDDDVIHKIVNVEAVDIVGHKVLYGKTLKAGDYTFSLEGEGLNLTAVNDDTGRFAFNDIPLDLTKLHNNGGTYTYSFTVKEVSGADGLGMTYDRSVYTVSFTLSLEKDTTDHVTGIDVQRSILKDGSAAQAVLFTNRYEISGPVTVPLEGTKELVGSKLKDREFRFDLYPCSADFVVPDGTKPLQSVYNQGNNFQFADLSFDQTGEYHYIVAERDEGHGGVDYDKSHYHVTIKVTDNNDGTLKAERSITLNGKLVDSIEFRNSYSVPDGTSIIIPIPGKKHLEGRPLEADEFIFQLFPADKDFKKTSDVVLAESHNNKDGDFGFKITFTKDHIGMHYFIIAEKDTDGAYIEYDPSLSYVTVFVHDDGLGGLTGNYTVRNSADAMLDEVVFKNNYVYETTTATIVKIWDDIGNMDGIRPQNLTVTLSNGTQVTLNESNGWKMTVTDLPKYDLDGNEIVYTWTEVELPAGYSLTKVEVNGTVTTLTNSHTPTPPTDPKPPQTGDSSMPGVWLAMCIMSLIGFAVFGGKKFAGR